jgi:hypothetical protein
VIARLAFLVALLAPGAAFACATCVASAYGDRTFNWAFLGLIVMPFVVGFGIAGVFAARHYAHSSPGRVRAPHGRVPALLQVAPHEETSL